MKNKKWLSILLVLGTILLSYLGFSKKFVLTSNSKLWPGSSSSSNKTFDHIDIQSVASFSYYVDGNPVNVNINFYDNEEELGNVSVYRKNQDGTLTNIPVSGSWRNQTGTFNGVRTEKEYSISGKFDRYYENTTTEVVYLVQFKLNVTIAGKTEELVYSEEYSFNSSNNVCPGKTYGMGQGIDVLLSGNKLQEFFSASLKIVKNVVGAEDNTFTFRVKALNKNIDFDKEVQITTDENTGSVILGGLVANEEYSITEINIPEGYQIIGENPIVFTATQNNTVTKTFVNSGKVVNITGSKTWKDNNNQDGIRPDSITVRLYADGVEVSSKSVTEKDNWTYNFTNMPEYNGNKKINYTVKEDTVKGYETDIDEFDITNTHEVEKINISGLKTWEDNNNQDGIRPNAIMVKLYADGVEIASKSVTAKDNWKYSFTNLDKYKDGKEIKYTVKEDAVKGYETDIDGFNITNTHEVEKIDITGLKTWEDNNNQDGIRPDSITIKLYADRILVDTKKVTAKDNWKYSFTNLDKYKDGKEIKYTLSEDANDGYKTTIDGFDITNTHEVEKIDITGLKTWEDNNNQDGIRPDSIIVRLYADGAEIALKEVTAKDNWEYSFTNLDKNKNGKEIKYTVKEDSIDGYKTTIDGFDITNTHEIEKIDISGLKTWKDNNNQDGIRPNSITIKLYADRILVDTKEVTAKDNWKYSFTNLDKNKNGKEIKYTLSEDANDGYKTTINGFDITNTHEVEKIDITGLKTWDDNDNQDGIRPDSIIVRLYADGSEIASKEVTAKDNWKYNFTNLDKNKDGKEIKYTVKEDAVKGYETDIDGFDITNTHEVETINISGLKTWEDNNNQDGIRPDSITVRLYADGTEIALKEITAKDNWKYSFTNLDKNKDGKEIKYTVKEDAVKGYETDIDGFDITNTHEVEKIDITGLKTWEDNNNQDGIRPDSIIVRLYADDNEIASKEVTAKDNWEYSFTNLDKNKNGKEIKYTVKEDAVKGYVTDINGFNITNTHEAEKINISGLKTWEDNNNQDGIRPDSITVRLYADGTEIALKEVTAKDNWKYSFTNLDKYKDGKEIKYTVKEDAVKGYVTDINGFNITNTHEAETININGLKTWDDNNNQDGIRPNSITVRLYADGTEITSKEVTAKDNWKYSFINLDKYKDGKEIKYTLSEDAVKGYETDIDGFDITNTHEVETINISGLKTWEDNNNQDGIRPDSITVRLYADGTEITSKEVTAKDNWKYSFTNLDKYKDGKEIKYTVKEDTVKGYVTDINGFNITNTHETEIINISGLKTWEDNNNQDGIRPDSIIVRLYADDNEFASKEVTAKDNWEYSFTNLDKYKDGNKIVYTVKEDAVDGYKTTINGFNITNIHETETINISGLKTWDDNDNQDGIRPDSIIVRLYADDNEIASKEVTANDNWEYSFTNLDKYKDGNEIVYTVKEDAIDGYKTTINGFNITNTHETELIKVMGKKIWNDNNNQDGIRPEFITVKLYADGNYVTEANITNGVNNDWTYAFIDLPKYKDGNEIVYTVKEDTVDGYNTSYDAENPFVIINTHLAEKIDLNGVKTWDDNNNQDGIRPNSIIVRLYADGTEITSKEVTANDNWKYSFTDLDKYKEGKEISYTISEDIVKGYSTIIDGYNITNTHEVEKININGVKTWDDNNNQDGIRPDFITVNLYGNNELLDSINVSEETEWKYEFTNLDKYKDGYEIVYDVTEEIVDGYETTIEDFNITNTHMPEKITFKATKIWDDNDNQDGIRQNEIIVKLFKNGELFKEVSITEENNWTYSFENLDRYENGVEIVYTVIEDIILGYETEINYTEIDANNIISATIVNTHKPEEIELNVTKIWLDKDNMMGLRPENIEVDLYADGEFVKTVVISKDNNWNYIFGNLAKYKNGILIDYTFIEKPVYGYSTDYEGSFIINTLDHYIYPSESEILPPQTGIKSKFNLYNYIILAIIGIFILKQKNA